MGGLRVVLQYFRFLEKRLNLKNNIMKKTLIFIIANSCLTIYGQIFQNKAIWSINMAIVSVTTSPNPTVTLSESKDEFVKDLKNLPEEEITSDASNAVTKILSPTQERQNGTLYITYKNGSYGTKKDENYGSECKINSLDYSAVCNFPKTQPKWDVNVNIHYSGKNFYESNSNYTLVITDLSSNAEKLRTVIPIIGDANKLYSDIATKEFKDLSPGNYSVVILLQPFARRRTRFNQTPPTGFSLNNIAIFVNGHP